MGDRKAGLEQCSADVEEGSLRRLLYDRRAQQPGASPTASRKHERGDRLLEEVSGAEQRAAGNSPAARGTSEVNFLEPMPHFDSPTNEKQYLQKFSHFFSNPIEGEHYVNDSYERIQVLLKWLKPLQAEGINKVLELGSNPYFLTLLMKKYLSFDLNLANYFGESHLAPIGTQILEGNGEKHEFHYSHFNLERDRAPYEDNSFDCVIFSEILEHLLLSADFPFSEIHRILKP